MIYRCFLLLMCFCNLPLMGQVQKTVLQDLLNRKQFSAVIQYTDSLTKADSLDYSNMSVIGQAYEGLLKYKNAYQCFLQCLSLDTTNVDALNAVARMAINLGKATEAEHSYRKVLAIDSANFYANYQLGRLYYQLGDYEKAVEQYNILRDQEPDEVNPTIHRNLGDCYTKMNALEAAAICYFLAYNANREHAGLADVLINTMLRMGGNTVKDALAICDTALYYNPNNRQLKRNKGMALYMLKAYQRADTLYADLLAEGDSSFLTLKYGGAARFQAGRPMDAIEPLELAYVKDTTDVETCLLLGASFGKTFDRKRAYQLFDQAEENMKPKKYLTDLLLSYRGETMWRDGRMREAEVLFYEVWKKDPSRIDLLNRISSRYSNWDQSRYSNDEERQRALFIKRLYLTETLNGDKPAKGLFLYRPFLESMYEDAFFRSVAELTMLAPDGKKQKLSVIDLRALINRLPEMTAEEKEAYDKQMEEMKKVEVKKQRNQK